jgi:tetratricopeptide (TPR) repeat protein
MLLLAPSRPPTPEHAPLKVSSPAAPPGPARPSPVSLALPLPWQGEPAAREEPRPVEHPVRERPAPPRQRPVKVAAASAGSASAAREHVAKGDKALRSFNPADAMASFQRALELDPRSAGAHRGMGMAYVLQGKNAEAKAEYAKYLQLAPEAPDREQIQRLLAR